MEFLFLAAFLGIIPGLIASSKGRPFIIWWLYGFLLFIVALIHSLVIKKDRVALEREQMNNGFAKCPFCAEMVKAEAIKCRHCGSDLSEQMKSVKPVSFCVRNVDYMDLFTKDGNSFSLNDEAIKTLVAKMKEHSKSTNPDDVLSEYQEDINYLSYLFPSSLQSQFTNRVKSLLDGQ